MRVLPSLLELGAYPDGWRHITGRTKEATVPGNSLWDKLETGCLLIPVSSILHHIKLGKRVVAAHEATHDLDEVVFG